MSSTENVAFEASHKPGLQAGEYKVTAQQEVQLKGSATDVLNESIYKRVYVAAPRFSINQNDIVQAFPPAGNRGNYHYVLPHVCLKSSTMPWERHTGTSGTPWLWLFIYDEDDVANGNVIPPKDLDISDVFEIGSSNQPSAKIPLTEEPGELKTPTTFKPAPVNVVQMNLDWLDGTASGETGAIMPSASHLQLMTSVRKNTEGEGKPVEHAICMANRMPTPGKKNYACLLSLEERLGTNPAYKKQGVNGKFTTFVCLKHWDFYCLSDEFFYEINPKSLTKLAANSSLSETLKADVANTPLTGLYTAESDFKQALSTACSAFRSAGAADQATVVSCFEQPVETFEKYMTNLSSDSFHFGALASDTTSEQKTINQYLLSGAAAFTHRLNTGDKAISWYHGPFKPSLTPPPAKPTKQAVQKPTEKQVETALLSGLTSSDPLLRIDESLNMMDVSYAAAWELGRLLTLKNKTVAKDLYLLRKQGAWKKNASGSKYAALIQPASGDEVVSKEQKAVTDWCSRLAQLENIPFNYLVSDERLLPEESIRFFTIDNLWINCLLDGALSIGRTSTVTNEEEAAFIQGFGVPQNANQSGFLIRSEAISAWPHLLATPTVLPGSGTGKQLPEVRLGTDSMLFLYDGQVTEVDIHLKPEGLHFGFNHTENGEVWDYSKKVRFSFTKDASKTDTFDATQVESTSQKTVNTVPFANADSKVVDIGKLNTDLQNNAIVPASDITFTSAEFAMEMVYPQPNIYFTESGSSLSTNTIGAESDITNTFLAGSGLFGKTGTIPPPDPGNGDVNFLAGAGSGGSSSGEEQDQEIMAIIEKVLAGGAAILEKLVEKAKQNGLTVPAHAGSLDPTAQQKYIEEIIAQIVEKGGMTLLESILEDVFKKDVSPKPQHDPTPQVDPTPSPVPKPVVHTSPVPKPTPEPETLDETGVTEKPMDKLLEGILTKLKAAKSALKQDEENLKADAEKVVDKVKGEVTHVKDEIEDKVLDAVSEVESVPQKVKAYIEKAKLDVTLTEAGLKITAGLIVDRIKAAVHDDVDKVKDKASELAQGILGHIHQAEADLEGKAKDVVGNVKADIHKGVEKVVEDVHLVESKAEDLKAEVADHIKDLEGHVVSAAKDTLAKVEGKVRSKVAELKAEEHLAKQKEAQLLDEISHKVHEVKLGITQKISEIKSGVKADETKVLQDAHNLVEEVEAKVKSLKTSLKAEVVNKFKALEHEALGFFKSPFDNVKQDVQEVKAKVHDDAEKVKADVEKDIQWLKARKTLVWIVLGLLVISIGTWIYRTAFVSEPPTPLLSHFEGVKQLDEIEFVKQHYEEAVPVTDKDGQLEFLLSVPATVSGKMDMTQLKYELGKDSLLKVTLPPVLLSDVNVDLQNVTSYDDRGKSMKLFLGGGGKAYGKAYASIIEAVEQVKKGVLSNAIKNDLMDETRQGARIYLLHIANSIGYRVEFVETKPSASFEKDIEDRVGKKLWEQLKHKVQKVDPVDKPASQAAGTESKREERRDARDDKKEDK